MAFANTSITDLMATGIDARNREIADNAMNNNPVFAVMKEKGRVKTFSGGVTILEEINYGDNANAGSYSGYDTLPVAASDNISAAQFNIKQYAVPITVSGLDTIQNSGKEGILDLIEERITVGEDSMANLLETDLHGDGSGNGGKALTGLGAIVEATATASQTSTVGGISRTNFSFWRNYCVTGQTTNTDATLRAVWNTAYAAVTRGRDQPDVIVAGSQEWGRFLASQQNLQRFSDPNTAKLGFMSLKYMNADVFLGGGVGGVMTSTHVLFLNTKYLRLRPFAGRNMVTLDPARRYATNQDAFTVILAWAGNLTCRGARYQGRTVTST